MWVKYFQRNTQHSSGLEYTFEKSMSLQLFKEENDTAKVRIHEAYGFLKNQNSHWKSPLREKKFYDW